MVLTEGRRQRGLRARVDNPGPKEKEDEKQNGKGLLRDQRVEVRAEGRFSIENPRASPENPSHGRQKARGRSIPAYHFYSVFLETHLEMNRGLDSWVSLTKSFVKQMTFNVDITVHVSELLRGRCTSLFTGFSFFGKNAK